MMRLLVGLSLVFAIGCDKPSEENCRKAIANMQSLLGTEHLTSEADLRGEIRRCRVGSSKEAVDCATKATTLDELRECGFGKIPDRITPAPEPDAGAAAGSPAGGAGEAPTGADTPADGAGAAPTGAEAPAEGAGGSPSGAAGAGAGAAADGAGATTP